MNKKIENGINILNEVTINLLNFNYLAIYLAKQSDINALKTLKLIILAYENKLLKKDFNINCIRNCIPISLEDTSIKKENIIGNLSLNPQHLGLLLMEFIIKNYKIDLSIEPLNNSNTYFDYWIKSFEHIENDQDLFYKRYDLIDKKLEIINYMIQNNLLDNNQINILLSSFNHCLSNEYNYTRNQLFIMKNICDKLKINEEDLENLKHQDLAQININQSIIDNSNLLNKQEIMKLELENFILGEDQCSYMLNQIPILTKKDIIK